MPRSVTGATYSALVALVNQYTNRSFTADSDATTGLQTAFILTNTRMAEVLRTPEMETTLSLTGSDFPTYTLPDDYLGIRSIIATRSDSTYAMQRTNLLSVRKAQIDNSGGSPTEYCTKGNTLILGPTPASSDTFEVVYYSQPAYLATGTDSNVFTERYPKVYLAGVLSEAYRIIQDTQMADYWEAIFERRLAETQKNAEAETYSGNLITIRNA